MRLKTIAVLLVACGVLNADPVVHKFEIWGTAGEEQKLYLFTGWSNGFIQARPNAGDFATCLKGMSTEQAMAMIDKYYRAHPERWSRFFGGEVLEALTVNAGPCEGKNPLAPERK
jgi:hypothetical protein